MTNQKYSILLPAELNTRDPAATTVNTVVPNKSGGEAGRDAGSSCMKVCTLMGGVECKGFGTTHHTHEVFHTIEVHTTGGRFLLLLLLLLTVVLLIALVPTF